jgi:hypothetical protein
VTVFFRREFRIGRATIYEFNFIPEADSKYPTEQNVFHFPSIGESGMEITDFKYLSMLVIGSKPQPPTLKVDRSEPQI